MTPTAPSIDDLVRATREGDGTFSADPARPTRLLWTDAVGIVRFAVQFHTPREARGWLAAIFN